jgi:flagellin
MPAILNTNMASLYAQKSLSTAQSDLAQSVQRLSSGKRINSAKDDAAGYALAEAVKAIKNTTDQTVQNTQNAISMVQTAEGALDVVGKMLQRALTLTTQLNGDATLTANQESYISAELNQLVTEVGSISSRTKFQGGTGSSSIFGQTLSFLTGEATTTTFAIGALSTTFSGTIGTAATTVTFTSTNTADELNNAIQINISNRATLGAIQNRLGYAVDNLQTLSNNLADAQSRILDTDYASETAKLTRGQILQQAATSMLAQANQMPNVILTLLK